MFSRFVATLPYVKTFALAAALAISAVPLFASSDLSITIESNSAALAGTDGWVSYSIHNAGPDTASGVVVTLAMTGATDVTCPGVCSGNILIAAGTTQSLLKRMKFMDEPGTVTITATVSSDAPDPNPADNSVTLTLVVPPDPDVTIFPIAPARIDRGLPFRLAINLGNQSAIAAHDVNATIDFRPDATVQSLPPGCNSTVPGRVTCHLDVITQGNAPAFNVTLVAPATNDPGSITFSATVTEREHDFDPASNTYTWVSQLNNTFLVTATANDGTGSLRQAILDANAFCLGGPLCSIAFRIAEPSTTGWKTIRITSPLPALTASNIRIDGASQSTSVGDGNPDGPEVEISGGGSVDGDGLTIEGCTAEVANLVINGFRRNGLSVTNAHPDCRLFPRLHDLFIGTDATGSEARPNGQRGIGIFVPPNSYGGGAEISSCVISGNALSGIFDLSGLMSIWGNRIGVKAHSDDPLPNGASGIFIGPGGYGSAIGADYLTPALPGNVIAFNREMGVAIAAGVTNVSVSGNRIWSNGGLGIDIGLDGPTMSTTSFLGTLITTPTLTLAYYDPVSNRTIVEGDTTAKSNGLTSTFSIDFFANDAAGPFGFGEGQRPISATTNSTFTETHFHIEFDGDLTGQFISATLTTMNYEGFAKPDGVDQGFLTQTSEFSRAIEVR
jgi:hypothetical protein